jgi:hypothetical protein
MSLLLALVLKPFVALAVLLPARVLERKLHREMKDGWLKRLLFLSW